MTSKNKEKFIKLLEAINTEGSINMAAQSLGISYRGAWLQLEKLKAEYPELTIVESFIGGCTRGSTNLTKEGFKVLKELKES